MSDFMKCSWLLCLTVAAWEDWRSRQVSGVILLIGLAVGIWNMFSSGIYGHLWAAFVGAFMLILSKATRGALGEGDGWFFLFSACFWNVWEIGLLFLGSLSIACVWGMVLLLYERWFKKGEGSRATIPFLTCAWPVGVWMVWL